MSDYYNRNNGRKKRSRREKIGFYTAFSICLIAVSMAIYSTYNTMSVPQKATNPQTETTQAQQVNQVVTGVTETLAEPKLDSTIPKVTAVSQEETTQPSTSEASENALETMLSTDLSLTYPLKSNNILREFSKESVYFKTPNVWKPHLGVDFAGELGDDVCAMADGAVTKVSEDKMYGKTIEISVNDAVCIYSGLGDISVSEGDSVNSGDKIGTVGSVPYEASDKNHIHVAVKVNGNYADPLSFIGNNN